MTRFDGKVAVVTGAASGIGQALACALAKRGAHLAICDVDETGLAVTADAATWHGARVHTAHVDVADRHAVAAYASQVRDHYGVIHQLYNNAGIAGDSSSVLTNDYAIYQRILDINLWGVIHGTKEFLPYLIASGHGHLVNISSINGIFAQSSASAYCASKFAVRGFTEAVRCDMISAGHLVKVTVVHPGGVKTNIAAAALQHATTTDSAITQRDRDRVQIFNDKLLRMPPAKAAAIILDGVARERARILVGHDARFVDAIARVLPRKAPHVAVWFEKRLFGTSNSTTTHPQ